MKMVCMWMEATFLFSLEHIHINWLRDHTSWAQVELEWRLRMFPSTSNLWFWISPHQGILSYSYILKFTQYMLLIANEVNSLIFHCVCFVCDTNMYLSNTCFPPSSYFHPWKERPRQYDYSQGNTPWKKWKGRKAPWR